MTRISSRSQRRSAGFSMVEVALALLIMSIGVLTRVGLMSGGLDMSKTATDYTQAAIFASDTMEGVRYYAGTVTNSVGVSNFCFGVQHGLALKAVAASVFDKDTGAEILSNRTANATYTTFFYSYETNLDFACRYRLSVEPVAQALNLLNQVACVKLDVINGLFGAAVTQSFYTEVIQFVR